MQKRPRILHLGLIGISSVISWVLATTVDLNQLELGALFNMYFPPLLGIVTFILFTILCLITDNRAIRLIILTLFCGLNLYMGLAFHFGI